MNDRQPFHRPVNTVFQNYALFPHLNVYQNIAFGLEMEGKSRPQIRQRVMSEGRLLQVGKPFDLYEYPCNQFVADFIGAANFLSGRVIDRDAQTIGVTIDENWYLQVSFPSGSIDLDREIRLMIRPEKVYLYPLEDRTQIDRFPNSMNGTISETIYLGTVTCHSIELSPHLQITARSQNIHCSGVHSYPPGTPVQVVLPAESLRIVE